MRFAQTMAVRADDAQALAELMTAWHEAEAGKAPGYLGSVLLADRDHPGRYLIVVHFSSAEEAEENDARPETEGWGAKLSALIDGDADFGNYDEIHTVG